MKSEQLYRELKDLADKLGIQVSEQNFRPTGIRVRSGYCLVKGKDHCIIDKHIKVIQKIEVLAECISMKPHESIYVVPAVREFLDRFKPRNSNANGDGDASDDAESHKDSATENETANKSPRGQESENQQNDSSGGSGESPETGETEADKGPG